MTTPRRAILFDFWQTLVSDFRERKVITVRQQLITDFLEEHGIRLPGDIADGFAEAKRRFFAVYQSEQRTASVLERIHWILGFFGLQFPAAELEDLEIAIGDAGLALNPEPTPHVKEMLATLSQDYPLGIVSDTGYTPGRVLRRHLRQHGLLDYFSAFSFSDETGHGKPHPETFRTALRQLQVEPDNAIHCGDLPKHDIIGAKALGITSVLYTGHHYADLDGIQPDYVVSDWRDLPDLVAQVFC
jgi:putative hydrolase of the HAD superfamily